MDGQIRIMILEDEATDVELTRRELRKAGLNFSLQWVQDKSAFLSALDTSVPDLLLADYSLPGFDGLTAISILRQRFPQVPVIIVSGAIGEEIAIEALKAGATDYVLKQRLGRLGPVVRRAIQETQQIAERKSAEQALRRSEERFHLFVEGVQDYAIIMLDPDGRITSWNAGAERIKGWNAGEALGQHISMFYLPQAQAEGEPQLALQHAAAEGRYATQGQRLRKDGTSFWADVTITALQDEAGKLSGFAKITRDITSRKQSEDAILQAKEEWEQTFENIPDLIAILDKDQHILRANRAMIERLERLDGEYIGQPCYQCVHALNHRAANCPYPLTLSDGQQHLAEVYEPRLGGYFLVSTTPLKDPQGQIFGVVHVARDITERKHMEEERERLLVELEQRVRDRTAELERSAQKLETANQELRGEIEKNLQINQALVESEARLREALGQEQAMRLQLIQAEKTSALARMVASVAHELNNPIQTIQNCMYLLGTNIESDSPVHPFLDMATTEAKRIARLVEQLRETYRPAKSTQAEIFNVTSLVENVQNILEPHLAQNQVRMFVSSPPEPVQVNGIADQIKQVFLNICLNAIEAMQPKGGSIWADIRPLENAKQVMITFKDSGPGISKENQSKIFEPFFTTKEKGTGLGLAICDEIIHNHSGKITVENQTGSGAAFTVWLPTAG